MYTPVRESQAAIDAGVQLMAWHRRSSLPAADRGAAVSAVVPLLVDQVMAEAGVVEPRVAARAVDQALGDASRAVSLLRSWASCLPRRGTSAVGWQDIDAERRITPAVAEPEGGQYLGASLDYAARLLDLGGPVREEASSEPGPGTDDAGLGADGAVEPEPLTLPRAAAWLEEQGLIAAVERAEPVDVTRRATAVGAGRGAFQQFLARAETGALTALAYSAVREGAHQADPTLVELRAGELPVLVSHPRTGIPVRVGSFPVTTCELVLYHVRVDESGEHTDSRFTLGYGVTAGRLERRAISAALLDARVARAGQASPGAGRTPADDAEWLITALDGQEATGFVEHLKLAHHVSFTSDLDRVRAAATPQATGEEA